MESVSRLLFGMREFHEHVLLLLLCQDPINQIQLLFRRFIFVILIYSCFVFVSFTPVFMRMRNLCVFFFYCIWYTVIRNALCGTHFSFEITFYLFARLKMMVFDQEFLRSEKKTQKNHCKYEGVPPILITIYCLTFCTKFSFTMFEWW